MLVHSTFGVFATPSGTIDTENCLIMSQSIPTGYIPPGQPREISSKTLSGGRDLTFESCLGAGNSTRAGFCGNSK